MEEPAPPPLPSRIASLSGISAGVQQWSQPSAEAYHQLLSRLHFLSPRRIPTCRHVGLSSALLSLDSYLPRAFRISPLHLASPGFPLRTDLSPSSEGVPSGHICQHETLERKVHLGKGWSELTGDMQLQAGGNQILTPVPGD